VFDSGSRMAYVISPVFFCIHLDVLLSSVDCFMDEHSVGVLAYADYIVS
jgi:hypothetical protein